MRIVQVDPRADTGWLDGCYQIIADGHRLDDSCLPYRSRPVFGQLAAGNVDPCQTWIAIDAAGQAAGCYVLTLSDGKNPALATCELAVDPGRRRAGIGTALLRHCSGQALEAGRSRLAGEVVEGSPGAGFAARAGAKAGIPRVAQHLVIDDSLLARLPAMRAEACRHASGYTLVSWLGRTPEELLDDSARLSAAFADAPSDQGVEPEIWDADRIRNVERSMTDGGRQICSAAARHDATGSLVALTQVATDPGTPGWARQGITAVLPGHRGRRLGTLVKIAMIELLTRQAPEIGHVSTRNAAANEHMVAINQQLGFVISSVQRVWELDLGRLAP